MPSTIASEAFRPGRGGLRSPWDPDHAEVLMDDRLTKITLDESEIPRRWYNVLADLPSPPPPVLHPGTHAPVGPDDLAPLFPVALIERGPPADHRDRRRPVGNRAGVRLRPVRPGLRDLAGTRELRPE